jgi:sugar phosphate isomerase/epimerase
VPELKIGLQLSSLRQPFRTALRTAAELGIGAIELDARSEVRPHDMSQSAIRQLRKLLDDLQLRVCGVSFYTRRGYGVPDELDRRVEATRQAMQLAYALGTPVVINQVGRVPATSEGPEWELLIDVLRDLGDFGQRVGATLCAETGSESGADLLRLVQALPDGALGVALNPGNLVVNGFSPLDAAELLGPYVRYVHVKDAVHDLGRGRGVEVEIGRGSVDFPALLGALEEHDYRGYYTIEREGAADPVFEIQQAIRFLKAL